MDIFYRGGCYDAVLLVPKSLLDAVGSEIRPNIVNAVYTTTVTNKLKNSTKIDPIVSHKGIILRY
jgi:hypothetical protein